jgi:autotransporter-associated beta strand protein
MALTKSGLGTQVLSGSNNFSGNTAITQGELRFSKRASLYSGNTALWTNLSVTNGATLGLSLGGTDGFASPDLDILVNNPNILKAGSKLGLDVASENGPVTLSTVLSNSANPNGITFSKSGDGELNLSGYTGTYTNPVAIIGGKLKFTQLSTYSGTPTITGGGVLDLNGASFLIPTTIALTGGSMVNFTAGVSDPFAPASNPSYTGFSFAVNNLNGNGRTFYLTNATLSVNGNVATNAFNISGIAGVLRLNGVTTNTSGYSLARIAFQNLTTGDLGYAANDTIEIDPPDLPGGVQATATLGSLVNVSGNTFNTFTSATLNNAGSGYSKPPAVRIITSTGSNLVTYAELKEVGTININNGGVMEFATNSSFSSLRPINPGDTNGGTVWVNGGEVFTKWSVIGGGTNKSGLLKVSGGSLVIDPYSANALYFGQYTGSGSLLLEGGEIQSPSLKVSGGGAANIRITGGTYLATTPTVVSGTVFSGSQVATNLSFSMEGGSLLATNSSFNFGNGVSNGNSAFIQTNGTIKTLEMNAQSGTFVMSGGTNECSGMVVGSVSSAPATFTQRGGLILINGRSGSVVAANDLVIGNGSGNGTYALNGGVLEVFGKIRKDVGTGALVLNGGTVRYTNNTNQASFITSLVDTTVGSNGAIFEITDPNVTNSIQATLKEVSVDQPGKLVKRGLGSLSIGRALLNYTGSTLIEDGKLVVTGTDFTAEIANNVVSMTFNPVPDANTSSTISYSILPGVLQNGTSSIVATQLASNQSITFDPLTATAQVVTTAVLANPPVITSASSFSATVGVSLSGQMAASGAAPITFSGIDLPAGITVNTDGLISGTPTVAGSFTATLTATNAGGATDQTVSFIVAKGTPVITLVPTATAVTEGQPLNSSALSGGSATGANGTVLEGTFAWAIGGTILSATGSYDVTFTPTSNNYNTATQTVIVTVNPAGQTIGGFLNGQPANAENLRKYAIGGATDINSPSEAPVLSLDATKLSLTAIVRTNDNKLTVVGEVASGLTSWSTAGVTMTVSSNTSGVPAGCQRQVFSVDRANNPSKQFLRLKAILQP